MKRLHETWRNIDGPPGSMLCVSAPPSLHPVMGLEECKSLTKERAGEIGLWFDMVRDFAGQAKFEDFFRAHQTYYDRTVAEFRKLITGDYITPVESYYGRKQQSYRLILGPLLLGNFGANVPAGAGLLHLYSIMGPIELRDGIPAYGSAKYVRELVWHEFGHSFSNPGVNLNEQMWQPYAALFEPIREQMGKLAYRRWSSCVIEHVNRAHVARIARRELGQAAAEAILKKEEGRGFRYIRALYHRLDEYEGGRDRYSTMDEFAPRLLSVFREISEHPAETAAGRRGRLLEIAALTAVLCLAIVLAVLRIRPRIARGTQPARS